MTEIEFWDIINDCRQIRDIENRIDCIADKLSRLSEIKILGFEKVLREKLHQFSDYGILAALYLIEGSASDDGFLYFRCRLILEGKELFAALLENVDSLSSFEIQDLSSGEQLLYVTDRAFEIKFGSDADKELPRDVYYDYLNYDMGYPLTGEDWQDEDLSGRFPKLYIKFRL